MLYLNWPPFDLSGDPDQLHDAVVGSAATATPSSTTTSPTSSTSDDLYFDYFGYWNIKTAAMRLLP
jgi:hypothetical protein